MKGDNSGNDGDRQPRRHWNDCLVASAEPLELTPGQMDDVTAGQEWYRLSCFPMAMALGRARRRRR
jgi:hypothetical protein